MLCRGELNMHPSQDRIASQYAPHIAAMTVDHHAPGCIRADGELMARSKELLDEECRVPFSIRDEVQRARRRQLGEAVSDSRHRFAPVCTLAICSSAVPLLVDTMKPRPPNLI